MPELKKFKFRDIRLSVFVKAPPERVYTAATSARQLCAWWVDRAETDIRNMGRFRLVWPSGRGRDGFEGRGAFVDLERGKKLAWMWDKASLPRGVPPLTSLFIESKRDGCQVTLVHAGFSARPSADRVFRRYAQGWEDCLAKLSLYAESGKTCKADQLSLSEIALLHRKRSA